MLWEGMAPDVTSVSCQERGKQNLLRFGVIMGWAPYEVVFGVKAHVLENWLYYTWKV